MRIWQGVVICVRVFVFLAVSTGITSLVWAAMVLLLGAFGIDLGPLVEGVLFAACWAVVSLVWLAVIADSRVGL